MPTKSILRDFTIHDAEVFNKLKKELEKDYGIDPVGMPKSVEEGKKALAQLLKSN